MKLGEILVSRGLISAAQLSEALEAQIIFGGHLGTCLIEAGCIDERSLGAVLAEACGLPVAGPESFHEIPRWVVESISPEMAERHKVVPIRRDDRELEVAMIDPMDLRVLDELKFASGCSIGTWIAPEARIYQALERYYDVPRRQRYVTLCRQLDEQAAERSGVSCITHETSEWEPVQAIQAQVAIAAASQTAEADSLVSELEQDLGRVTDLLCRVKSEKQVAELALDFVCRGMPRSILFRVKSSTATIWSSRGFRPPLELDASTFSVADDPLFRSVRGSDHYRGPLAEENRHGALYEAMGSNAPAELLLVPVHVEDRLIAMFYGDSGARPEIRGDTDTYRRMAQKLGLALYLVRIKQRIRAI